MRLARSLLSLAVALNLAACFVQHAEPIGMAEPAAPGQWSGFWVAEPLEASGEPGFFAIADVDPKAGAFSVSEADADGNPTEKPTPLLLRRVGETLFLDVQERPGDPWLLFVVAEMSSDHIVLAWVPETETFRNALATGELAGSESPGAPAGPTSITLVDFSQERQSAFAKNWQNLFNEERMVLRRVPTQ